MAKKIENTEKKLKNKKTKNKISISKIKEKKNNKLKKYFTAFSLIYFFIAALILLKTRLISPTSATINEYIDQQQLLFESDLYFTDQWQSFTAGKNGQLSKISVFGTIYSLTTLNIYEGEGINGVLLASQSVPTFISMGWIDISINNPIFLQAGSRYTFQFISSEAPNNLWAAPNRYEAGRHSDDTLAGEDLAFKIYMMPKLTKTLVIFLTKYPDSSYSDLTGVKQALENELYSNIKKMSYNTDMLDVTYVGPYIGDIENCATSTNAKGAAIVNYAVNRAYRDGIDVTQYENFIALRNYDFMNDDCFNTGEGDYSNNIQYDDGVLTAGMTTIGYPRSFSDTSFGHGTRRTVHEFLHGYGRGTSHTTELECYTDPNNKQNTRVPYYYIGDENVLTTPFCDRNKSSKIDVMGISPDEYIQTNAITKLQYNWINLSNISTFNLNSLIENVDQQQLSYLSGSYFTDQWQSFTAMKNGRLSKIGVFGTINSLTTLNIYEGEGMEGNLLSTQTVPEHLNLEWIDIPINNSIQLQAGNQYTFQFTASSATNNLWWDNTDPYTGGRHSYDAPAGQDLAFKTYVMENETEREFILEPIDKQSLTYGTQMVIIPIPNTTKAYVLELRGGAPTGTGVYLYLMPDRNNLIYQEQYLLNTGESYFDGYNYYIAPMKVGTTTIDSQMKLSINIESATEENAVIKIQINNDNAAEGLQTTTPSTIINLESKNTPTASQTTVENITPEETPVNSTTASTTIEDTPREDAPSIIEISTSSPAIIESIIPKETSANPATTENTTPKNIPATDNQKNIKNKAVKSSKTKMPAAITPLIIENSIANEQKILDIPAADSSNIAKIPQASKPLPTEILNNSNSNNKSNSLIEKLKRFIVKIILGK